MYNLTIYKYISYYSINNLACFSPYYLLNIRRQKIRVLRTNINIKRRQAIAHNMNIEYIINDPRNISR